MAMSLSADFEEAMTVPEFFAPVGGQGADVTSEDPILGRLWDYGHDGGTEMLVACRSTFELLRRSRENGGKTTRMGRPGVPGRY